MKKRARRALSREGIGALLVSVAAIVLCAGAAGPEERIDLLDIVEIRGFQPPPDMDAVRLKMPPPVDLKGDELTEFLQGYEYVGARDIPAAIRSSSHAMAVFYPDRERPVTFSYAYCPWEADTAGAIRGRPQLIEFLSGIDVIIFQRKGLCGNPPPGYSPEPD